MNTKRHSLLLIARITVLLFLAVNLAMGTTWNVIGIVHEVKEVKFKWKGELGIKYQVVLRSMWGQTAYPGEDEVVVNLWPIYKNNYFFLDGKKTTAKEALKPGRMIKIMRDIGYYSCYSKDYRFSQTAPDSFGSDRGVYRLRLPEGASLTYLVKKSWKHGEEVKVKPKALQMDLFLHVLCQKGKVVSAGAAQTSHRPNWNTLRIPSLPVDPSGLRIEDGRLRGSVTVSFPSSQWHHFDEKYQGQRKRSFEIDAPLGEVSAGGTYTLVGGELEDGEQKERPLTIRGAAEPVLSADRTVWFRMTGPYGGIEPRGVRNFAVSARIVDGKLQDGLFTGLGKGEQDGRVTSCALQWDGHRFSGTVEVPDANRWTGTIKVEGVRIGDQLFGTCSSTSTKGETMEWRIRGGVLEADAPPIMGWTEGLAKKQRSELEKGVPLPEVLLK